MMMPEREIWAQWTMVVEHLEAEIWVLLATADREIERAERAAVRWAVAWLVGCMGGVFLLAWAALSA